MLKMNGGDEDKVCLIQKKIRERILIRRTHFDIGYDLYKQEKNAIRTFLLVDVFLDDEIDTLIDIYNKKSLRLFLPSFEDLSETFFFLENIND